MAKKNMDALLSNIMGEEIVRPTATPVSQDSTTSGKTEEPHTTGKPEVPEDPWKHFSFICSVELADKVQAIAHKEGFTIRALMEYMMRQGVATYESKNGKVRKIKHKGVTDVM